VTDQSIKHINDVLDIEKCYQVQFPNKQIQFHTNSEVQIINLFFKKSSQLQGPTLPPQEKQGSIQLQMTKRHHIYMDDGLQKKVQCKNGR